MKMKPKLIIISFLILISNLTFGNDNYKRYDNFQDVYIIRNDIVMDNKIFRYLFIFRKQDDVLLITKLCEDKIISNQIEFNICNDGRINL